MHTTAIIAEDEPLLRERLQQMLGRLWPALQVVATVRNGKEAVEAALLHQPRVAFLDIRMPLMTGLQAAQQLAGQDTHIVFVTAFEEYAVKAFEAGALDYIIKPFDEERLAHTVACLQQRTAAPAPDMQAWLAQFARQLAPGHAYLQWIRASVGTQVRLLQVSEVLFFQADDKYTRVATTGGELLIRKTIKELTDELDPKQFVQIHRATVVNLNAIDHVQRNPVDYWELKLKGSPEVLRISRSYLHVFKQM
jgi:DNA-binding LytR/AlgR family response regulator